MTRRNIFIKIFLITFLVTILSTVQEPLYGDQITNDRLKDENIKNKKLPTPTHGYGHAKGIMLHKGEITENLPIYLIIHTSDKRIVKIVNESKAYTDNTGYWFILNIEPGIYSVRPNIPKGLFLTDPNYTHEVKAGQVTDFGVQDFLGELNNN